MSKKKQKPRGRSGEKLIASADDASISGFSESPHKPVIHRDDSHGAFLRYVRVSEIPEGERQEFMEFMVGQTRPVIDGLDPQDAVYVCDYANWKSKKLGRKWYFD